MTNMVQLADELNKLDDDQLETLINFVWYSRRDAPYVAPSGRVFRRKPGPQRKSPATTEQIEDQAPISETAHAAVDKKDDKQ